MLQHTLSNGLTILAEPGDAAHSFAAGFFVKTGSRDESPDVWGVSHFLEHMLFKGSETTTWQEINQGFDDIGARYNAFTTQEMTAYYGSVLPEFSDRLLELLGQLMRPALRQHDFDTEKNVILEEIAMYNDEPQQLVYEKLMEAHFDGDSLGRSVIGTADSIAAMTRTQMLDYYESRYSPANLLLSVAGVVDFDRLCRAAERLFGHWRGAPVRTTRSRAVGSGRRETIVDPKLNRRYTMAMCPGPSAQDDDRFAARVLADVIGDAEGSRLYWALIDPALADEADFGFYPHDGCGSFYLSLVADPDAGHRPMELALAELRRVRDDLHDAEVERARNKIETQLVISAESPGGRMRAIGSQWLYNGDYRSLDDDMASLEAVTTDRIRALLDRYSFEPMTIVSLAKE